jgi:hypothetical protein
MRSHCLSVICSKYAAIVVIFWIRDLNASCVSCMVVTMAMRIGREGWGVGDNDVDGGWL